MKRVPWNLVVFTIVLACVVALLMWLPGQRIHAQSTNNNQTTSVRLLNASSATGRVVVPAANQIGAMSHYFTYCTTATTLQLITEESADNVAAHFVPTSTTYGVPSATANGNPCAIIQFGGYFNFPALNVLSIAGGTVSAWYSAGTGAVSIFPPAVNSVGSTTPVQCDQTIFTTILAANSVRLLIGVASQNIYVCGFTFSLGGGAVAGVAPVLTMDTGTGSLCGTGTLIPWSVFLTTATPQVNFIGSGSVGALLKVPKGADLCFVNSGTTGPSVQVALSYAQF